MINVRAFHLAVTVDVAVAAAKGKLNINSRYCQINTHTLLNRYYVSHMLESYDIGLINLVIIVRDKRQLGTGALALAATSFGKASIARLNSIGDMVFLFQ